MNIRVLVVTNMYPEMNDSSAHAGIFVKEQIESLRKKNVIVDVFIIKGFLSKFNYISSIFEVYSRLKNHDYDIVHVHYGLSGLFVLFKFLMKCPPVVITLHGGDILSDQGNYVQVFITKNILKFVDHVIYLNRKMERVLIEYLGVEYQNKLSYIPCGVDNIFFNRDLSIVKEKLILFPGDPNRPEKNYSFFHEIFLELRNIDSSFHFVPIFGFSREEIKKLFSRASALVMTSTSEGSPQVIKEAITLNVPVFSTDVGDIKELFNTCDLVKIFSQHDLPSDVAKIIFSNLSSVSEIGAHYGRNYISKIGLKADDISGRIISLYNRLSRDA